MARKRLINRVWVLTVAGTFVGWYWAGGVGVSQANAQEHEPTAEVPSVSPQAVPQVNSEAPRVHRRRLQTWTPLQSAEPSLGVLVQQVEAQYAPLERVLIPEGSQLPPTRGTPIRIPSGEWVFVFHKGEDERVIPPMIMLPSPMLEQVEQEIDRYRRATPDMAQDATTPFIVGGQVQYYRGRNYLLPTSAIRYTASGPDEPGEPGALAQADAADADDAPTGEGVGGTSGGEASVEIDRDVAALIEELDGARDLQRPIAGVRTSPGDLAESTSTPLPTDTMVVRLTGRVERAAGVLVFRPDNDVESVDADTFILQPCSNLAGIEQIALYRGTGVTITVSGRALSYRRQMFLLPTMYQVSRTSELTPMQ